MKKLLAITLFAVFCVLPVLAQQDEKYTPIWDHGNNVSELSYQNVRIYKIFDQVDGYVIIYEKGAHGTGTVVVPKAWYKDRPVKLQFRELPKGITPYLTLYKLNGEFYKVVLSVPDNRRESVWGVIKPYDKVPITNNDKLEL